jgi:ABC-type branched-subunit amino acid transport system permease subunit
MVIILAILYLIDNSRVGKIFRGIRQSDTLAESVGVNTNMYRIMAFTISCFFTGIVGGLYGQYISTITPDTFGFLFGIYILIYMTVGGSSVFIGPILGTILLTLLPEVLRPLKDLQPYFFAAILMIVIFLMPEGIVGIPKRIQLIFQKKRPSDA